MVAKSVEMFKRAMDLMEAVNSEAILPYEVFLRYLMDGDDEELKEWFLNDDGHILLYEHYMVISLEQIDFRLRNMETDLSCME